MLQEDPSGSEERQNDTRGRQGRYQVYIMVRRYLTQFKTSPLDIPHWTEKRRSESSNLSKIAASGQLELSSHMCFLETLSQFTTNSHSPKASCVNYTSLRFEASNNQSTMQIKTIVSSCPSRKIFRVPPISGAQRRLIEFTTHCKAQASKFLIFQYLRCLCGFQQVPNRLNQDQTTTRQSLIVASHRWASWACLPLALILGVNLTCFKPPRCVFTVNMFEIEGPKVIQ